jgi:hypothetical protein
VFDSISCNFVCQMAFHQNFAKIVIFPDLMLSCTISIMLDIFKSAGNK